MQQLLTQSAFHNTTLYYHLAFCLLFDFLNKTQALQKKAKNKQKKTTEVSESLLLSCVFPMPKTISVMESVFINYLLHE